MHTMVGSYLNKLMCLYLYLFTYRSTWGCPKSKFDWTYSDQETAYLIKGLVTVTPKNKSVFGDAVTVKAGDIVTFPAGMDCVWDVQEDLHKHYRFD